MAQESPEESLSAAEGESETRSESGPRASSRLSPVGFWQRLGAYLFDWAVIASCSAIVATLLNLGAKSTTTSAGTDYVYANAGWPQLIFLALSAVYAVAGWMFWTSTLMQRALGVSVVRADSDEPLPLSFEVALLRWFLVFGLVAGLGALVILLPGLSNAVGLAQLVWIVVLIATTFRSSTGQGFHDRLVGSMVVER